MKTKIIMQFESSEHDLRSRQVHEKRESVLSLHKEEYFEKNST